MSREKQTQALFQDAANEIDKLVGKHVHKYQPIISRNEERGCYNVSFRALCLTCNKPIMANIGSDQEQWAKQLIDFFVQRVEFHAKSHNIILANRLPKRLG